MISTGSFNLLVNYVSQMSFEAVNNISNPHNMRVNASRRKFTSQSVSSLAYFYHFGNPVSFKVAKGDDIVDLSLAIYMKCVVD